MWEALKEKFDGILNTRLKHLTIKFDNFELAPNTLIRYHLRVMHNMTREMSEAS